MTSKKVLVAADGTATATDATLMDVATTLFSTDSALTGTYGLLQRGGLFVAGMSLQSKRKLGTFNPL